MKRIMSILLAVLLIVPIGTVVYAEKTENSKCGVSSIPLDDKIEAQSDNSFYTPAETREDVKVASQTSVTHRYTVLLLDTVSSYYLNYGGSIIYTVPTSINTVKQAAQQFVDAIYTDTSGIVNHVAIISFGSSASIRQNFTTTKSTLTTAINNLSSTTYGSNLNSALTTAESLLDGVTDSNASKNIILFLPECASYGSTSISGKYSSSDCTWVNADTGVELYRYANSAYATAERLKSKSDIYSIGLFASLVDAPEEGKSYVEFCKSVVKDIQNKGYYEASNLDELVEAFNLTALELIDTDGDGLPDVWEKNGYDVTVNNQKVHVALNEMGADPNIKDVFVEIDWMVRPDGKNLRPTQSQIDRVIEAFRNASVANGIRLHVDFGSDSYDAYSKKTWSQVPDGSHGSQITYDEVITYTSNSNEWSPIVENNFSEARAKAFHYCIFANKYDTGDGTNSTGVALGGANNMAGQYFIVARGVTGDDETAVAGTFMHELGHTLGLDHGGGDGENYKPNYISVMNYLFQLGGLVGTGSTDGKLDYSRAALPSLNENSLNENDGIDPNGITAGTGLGTLIPFDFWTTPFKDWYKRDGKWFQRVETIAQQPVNFNHSVNLIGLATYQTSVKADLNPGGKNQQDDFDVLRGYDDWSNLKFKGRLSEIGMGGTLTPTVSFDYIEDAIPDEITLRHALQIGLVDANYNLPSLTLKRKETTDAFSVIDTDYVNWVSSNPKILDIDDDGNVYHGTGRVGTVTITAVDSKTGETLGNTKVRTTWTFWQWILVIFAFGWLYL